MGVLPNSLQKIGNALIICDDFTKEIDRHAMRNEVAKLLLKFVTRFGLTDQILTDQGTDFNQMCYSVKQKYEPQYDGQLNIS